MGRHRSDRPPVRLLPRHLSRQSFLVRRRGPARPQPALGDHRGSPRDGRRPRPVLRRHRRPRRRHLPGVPRPSGPGPACRRPVDGNARHDLAPITGLDDHPDLRQRQRRQGRRQLRRPHLPARAVHGLRRDPERGQGAHLLRRQQLGLLQRRRRHVRLELELLAERPRARRTAALGLQPDRPRARECREGTPSHHGRHGHRDDGAAGDLRRRPVADRGPHRRRHEDGGVQGPPALGASGRASTPRIARSKLRADPSATASPSGTSTSTTSSRRSACSRWRPPERRSALT